MTTDSWITKEQAATLLNTSTRTIERHIRAGRLQTTKQRRPGKSPETLVHSADVNALQDGAYLLSEAQPVTMHPTPSPQGLAKSSGISEIDLMRLVTQATKAAAEMAAQQTAATLATIQKAEPATPKAWLLLNEASDRSGLSAGFIRDLAKNSEIDAIKDGNRWKISLSSLMQWKPRGNTLATPAPTSKSKTAAGK